MEKFELRSIYFGIYCIISILCACSLRQFQICQTYGENPSCILLLRCKYVVPCEYLFKNVDFITWFEVKLMPFLFCYYSRLWVIVSENFICQDYSSCHSPLLQFIKKKKMRVRTCMTYLLFFLSFFFFFFFIKWLIFISIFFFHLWRDDRINKRSNLDFWV